MILQVNKCMNIYMYRTTVQTIAINVREKVAMSCLQCKKHHFNNWTMSLRLFDILDRTDLLTNYSSNYTTTVSSKVNNFNIISERY